ncbi:MAG: GTPase Era, partial [Thermodesulfobacteriota bacterium]
MSKDDFRAGFVGLIGAPNAGKSTLLNAFLGQKVAITSAKPQTTRRRILGVVTRAEAQMVFLDTPGLHDPKSPLHKGLVSVALGALEEADVVMWLLDVARPRPREEGLILGHLRSVAKPVLVALNKIDLINKARLLPMMEKLSRERDFAAIVPVSALTGDGLEILAREIIKLLPPDEALFPPDALTDQTERDLAAEFIREQVLRFTEQEVPHGATVVVEAWQVKPEKNLTV